MIICWHPASCRGTYASSRYVEVGLRWTRMVAPDERHCCGREIVWSWSPGAETKLADSDELAGDGGKRAGPRGDHV